MRIDIHNHVYPPDYLDALRRQSAFDFLPDDAGRESIWAGGARIVTLTPEMTDLGERVAVMDDAGIDVQVLSLTAPNVYVPDRGLARELTRSSNEYLAGCARDGTGRFLAMGSVPLQHVDLAMEELAHALDSLRMNALIIGTNIDGERLDAPVFREFFEEVARRRVPILLHPMTPWGSEQMGDLGLAPLAGFVADTTLTVMRMVFAGVLEELPDLRLVLPHAGGTIPYLWERFDNGWRAYPECRRRCPEPPSTYLARLYYDTVSFHVPALHLLRDTVGADRMIMGSDYPHVIGDPYRAVTSIREMDVSREEEDRIFSGNALSLLANVDVGALGTASGTAIPG